MMAIDCASTQLPYYTRAAMSTSSNGAEDLGLGLKPGDAHYRAYVGPPEDYDLIAAMTFNLLTTLGLRQHHTLLDIGCGSLRAGRLLIPYLNAGRYIGIEPNRWLVDDGIRREVGADLIRIKQPRFLTADGPEALTDADGPVDFAVAQSIFSHCGLDLIRRWLSGLAPRLSPSGALAATYLPAETDFAGSGWVYPDCVTFTPASLARVADDAGLTMTALDWWHPRQSWALFHRPGFDTSWFRDRPLSWNTRRGA
jgi:SAM-dependent methyltransferase